MFTLWARVAESFLLNDVSKQSKNENTKIESTWKALIEWLELELGRNSIKYFFGQWQYSEGIHDTKLSYLDINAI